MREIKFRVYTSDEGMIYNSVDCFISVNSDGTIDNTGHPTHHVMQFTGLRDKNGKEIYEGDIVSVYENGIGTTKRVVVFGASSFALSHDYMPSAHLDDFSRDSFEVIGNIHQTQERLQS